LVSDNYHEDLGPVASAKAEIRHVFGDTVSCRALFSRYIKAQCFFLTFCVLSHVFLTVLHLLSPGEWDNSLLQYDWSLPLLPWKAIIQFGF
jgi:hypothetical protein